EYATWESERRPRADEVAFEKMPAAGSFDPRHPPAGDDYPVITSAQLVDPATGAPRAAFAPGDDVAVRVHVRNGSRREPLAVAVGVMRNEGTICFAHSSQHDGVVCDQAEFTITLHLKRLRLLSGEFVVPVWLLDAAGLHRFHERPVEQNLVVQNRTLDLGLFLQEHQWQIEVSAAK